MEFVYKSTADKAFDLELASSVAQVYGVCFECWTV